jgi:hypothetical protein
VQVRELHRAPSQIVRHRAARFQDSLFFNVRDPRPRVLDHRCVRASGVLCTQRARERQDLAHWELGQDCLLQEQAVRAAVPEVHLAGPDNATFRVG